MTTLSLKAYLQSRDTGEHPTKMTPDASSSQTRPFITIARQAGAGGRMLARALVDRLNQIDPGPEPWRSFDRELVDRVAIEHRIPASLLEGFTERQRTWLSDLLQGFTNPKQNDRSIAARMHQTVRTIAEHGRAVIVGAGGVFVTRGMERGLHVYLVAPDEARALRFAQDYQLTMDAARKRVHEVDAGRASFYASFFPGRRIEPESFDVVLNTASFSEDQLVDALLPLLPVGAGASTMPA